MISYFDYPRDKFPAAFNEAVEVVNRILRHPASCSAIFHRAIEQFATPLHGGSIVSPTDMVSRFAWVLSTSVGIAYTDAPEAVIEITWSGNKPTIHLARKYTAYALCWQSRMQCMLLVKLLHAIARILTSVFYELAGHPPLGRYVTEPPVHFGTVYADTVHGHSGYGCEEMVLGGRLVAATEGCPYGQPLQLLVNDRMYSLSDGYVVNVVKVLSSLPHAAVGWQHAGKQAVASLQFDVQQASDSVPLPPLPVITAVRRHGMNVEKSALLLALENMIRMDVQEPPSGGTAAPQQQPSEPPNAIPAVVVSPSVDVIADVMLPSRGRSSLSPTKHQQKSPSKRKATTDWCSAANQVLTALHQHLHQHPDLIAFISAFTSIDSRVVFLDATDFYCQLVAIFELALACASDSEKSQQCQGMLEYVQWLCLEHLPLVDDRGIDEDQAQVIGPLRVTARDRMRERREARLREEALSVTSASLEEMQPDHHGTEDTMEVDPQLPAVDEGEAPIGYIIQAPTTSSSEEVEHLHHVDGVTTEGISFDQVNSILDSDQPPPQISQASVLKNVGPPPCGNIEDSDSD